MNSPPADNNGMKNPGISYLIREDMQKAVFSLNSWPGVSYKYRMGMMVVFEKRKILASQHSHNSLSLKNQLFNHLRHMRETLYLSLLLRNIRRHNNVCDNSLAVGQELPKLLARVRFPVIASVCCYGTGT